MFSKEIGIGRGKNVSGVYIKEGGYVLVYSKHDNAIVERKYILGKSAPENFEGRLVSMSDIFAKTNTFAIESCKGRLRQIK
ncbi:MAG TPA: hypothetical protein VIL03_03750 [Clostridia bacterium]|mgnify:CR=1 FL=1|jgi:hypothetical protein